MRQLSNKFVFFFKRVLIFTLFVAIAAYTYWEIKSAKYEVIMENTQPIRTEEFIASTEEKAYVISTIQRLITIISSQHTPPNLNPENDAVLGNGGCDWPKGPDSKGHWALPQTKNYHSLKGLPEAVAFLGRPFEDKNFTWSIGGLNITPSRPHVDFDFDVFIHKLGLKLIRVEPVIRTAPHPKTNTYAVYEPRRFYYESTNLINNVEVEVGVVDETDTRPSKDFPSEFYTVTVRLIPH